MNLELDYLIKKNKKSKGTSEEAFLQSFKKVGRYVLGNLVFGNFESKLDKTKNWNC